MWFAVVLVSIALSAPPAPTPAHPPRRDTPERVIITRPRGFAWREALLGSLAAGVAMALIAGGAELRSRRTHRPPKGPRGPPGPHAAQPPAVSTPPSYRWRGV
jgi:hypothetical protein